MGDVVPISRSHQRIDQAHSQGRADGVDEAANVIDNWARFPGLPADEAAFAARAATLLRRHARLIRKEADRHA